EASAAVHGLASERLELRGMGTTATVCALRDQELAIAQVGDSRAYLFRDGSLTLLTRDQSLAMHLVESGQLAPEELESCAFRHVILQAVGSEWVDVDLRAVCLRRGDVLLVCSDGLWDVLSGDAIAAILARSASVAAACEELVARALAEGGPDNVTCIVARARGDALDPPVRGEAPASRAVVL